MSQNINDKNHTPMPLEGVRVVEYGVFHAGPGACAILGDLGAEVIKIETHQGDPIRFWLEVGGLDLTMADGQSVWFQISNRNKKSICLDIETREGREIFHRLLQGADVFLTNLRKSTKAKLAIDYPSLSPIHPKLIHASVSGFGPEGPLADQGAFDPLGQGRSGMMFVTGAREPALLNAGVLDQATAIAMSHAILGALFSRERTGQGQEVHVSLYSTGLWLLYGNMMMLAGLSVDPNIDWDRRSNSPLRNRFKCQDGKWMIGTHHPEERYWPVLCRATEQTGLPTDPRFLTLEDRRAHCAELVAIFDGVFQTRPRQEWLDILLSHGLMFAPVQHLQEVFEDPQAVINGYVVDFPHPAFGNMKIPGYPAHFSAARAGIQKPAPNLGQHTDEVMQDLGFSEKQIQELKDRHVIQQAP